MADSLGELPQGTEIEATPLDRPAANFRTTRMRVRGPNQLEIGASRNIRLFQGAFVGFGIGGLVMGFAHSGGDENPAVAFLVGGVFLVIGLVMVAASRWVVFDREESMVHVRSLFKRESWPLDEILAVQVVNGGYHSMSNGGGYTTYQLNLVRDGDKVSRVGLSNHSDRDWTAETGVTLAEFLGVPLLSTVAVRDETAKEEERRLERRGLVGVAGAFLGFFGGFVGFAALMFNVDLPFEQMMWLFPLSLFGGLVLGAILAVQIERKIGRRG